MKPPIKIWVDSDCGIDDAEIYPEKQFDTVEYILTTAIKDLPEDTLAELGL